MAARRLQVARGARCFAKQVAWEAKLFRSDYGGAISRQSHQRILEPKGESKAWCSCTSRIENVLQHRTRDPTHVGKGPTSVNQLQVYQKNLFA